MVLDFECLLSDSLDSIGFSGEKHEFLVHDGSVHEINPQCSMMLDRYSTALHGVVDHVNGRYSAVFGEGKGFDLLNWVRHNNYDELAYFLSETGNNCLNHSQNLAPHKIFLYLGSKGFVVAVEHEGEGFDAKKVDFKGIYQNEGAAFDFYRGCGSKVFFDDKNEAKVVFMEFLL